jgi:glycosyltransferase involved in cell wall biosynthesis
VRPGGLSKTPRPIVTALLPNYNHSAFIAQAIGGLVKQTHPPDEIIVIDDASTDDSVAVIEKLGRDIPTLRLIRHRSNQGATAALNRGLEDARGTLVYFGSADDFAHPVLFATLLALLQAHPQAGLACGDTRCIDMQGRTVGFRPVARPLWRAGFVSSEKTRKLLRAMDHWMLGGASLLRADLLKALGGLDDSLGAFADAYALRRLALRNGFCYTPEVLADWRIVATSYSHSIAGDAEKCIRLIDSARQAISADPKFPTWYEAHYERRLRFALSRHAVETRPFNTSVLAAMNGDRAIDRAVLAGAERLPRISAKIAALAWLTLRYRPTSLTRVAITSLLRYFERKVQT